MATVARDLRSGYRLGTTLADGSTSWLAGATDDDEPRVEVPLEASAKTLPPDMIGVKAGAYVNPVIPVIGTAGAGVIENPYEHVYLRIWVIPDFIAVQNPALLTNIPFRLWSAYTVGNTLNSIVATGNTGLTLDISAPSSFAPVEERVVNLQVTSTAPVTVHATYNFIFTLGSGTFIFDATLLEWIKTIPESPVVEEWEWFTDQIVGWNGKEQRIGARRQPRRRVEYPILVRDDVDRREWYDRFHQFLKQQVLIPFFQYHTVITQNSAISATKIFFDPARTDFRDTEYAIIFRPGTEGSFVLKTSTIVSDGANLAAPLTVQVNAGDLVAPAFFGRLDNQSGIAMRSVAGRVAVGAFIIDFRSQFNRPGSVAVITSFDGLNVLERRPVVTRGEAAEQFDAHPFIVDNLTGVHASKVAWLHPKVGGGRQYVVARRRSPVDMDYWRDFLTAVNGGRVPFLTSTFRRDLVLAATPPAGATQVRFQGTGYAGNYFPHDTYLRFAFTNPSGSTIYRKATGAASQMDGTSLVDLDTPLPATSDWAVGFDVAYLNRVRLRDDSVRLTHTPVYTLLDLSLGTTDQ